MKKFIKLLVAIIALGVLTAAEIPTQFRDIKWYKVYYGGMEVGNFTVDINKQSNLYAVNVEIKSKGLAKSITKYWASASSKSIENEGGYTPQSFFAKFNLRKKIRDIKITYNDKGEIASYSNIPEENPGKRPRVEKKYTDNAYDPLTAALVIREKVRQSVANGSVNKGNIQFDVPVYDGRRRSDLSVKIHGRTIEKVLKKDTKVIHISFENKPVAGFTERELDDLPRHNPTINVYISDDAMLLPVKGDGQTIIGLASGGLYKNCKTLAECQF